MRRDKWFALILVFVFTFSLSNTGYSQFPEDIGNLVLKTNGGGTRPDYGLYIAQYLRNIGFTVEVKIEEWIDFLGTWPISTEFDLGIVEFNTRYMSYGRNMFPRLVSGSSPDMREVFTEDGLMNIFGLDSEIPYCNASEIMQQEGVSITNLEERQQHYYEWQNLMMDRIVPILPLYSAQSHEVVWANTLGYNASWGLSDSLPYMSFDGLHEGQTNLTEFNIADFNWLELNPLFINDAASALITNLVMEPIVQFSPDFIPTTSGLVENWTKVDDHHYKFVLRDNIFWNPSYNITERNASSVPLSSIPIGELMLGLKNGEYSNSTNQQITAKDAVFTYLLWSNPDISLSTIYYEWISDIYVDPIDELAFHIHIDGNPETPESDPYVDMWSRLPAKILPEFFLNSTNVTETYSAGGVKCTGLYPDIVETPQWQYFTTSAFGCGKFMMNYYIRNSTSVLTKNPNWFGIGAITGSAGMDIFVNRIIIEVIPDKTVEISNFESGNLDWIVLINIYPIQINQILTNPNFLVQSLVIARMSFLFFNLDRPLIGGVKNHEYLEVEGKENYTKGVAIRKAINYAIDREEMNIVLHDGEFQITHSVLFPYTEYYYYNDIIKYNYDLDSAFEWLEAAGLYFTSEGFPGRGGLIFLYTMLGLIPTIFVIVTTSNIVSNIKKKRISNK
jgi:ABC-type transport system substrate-binding protein